VQQRQEILYGGGTHPQKPDELEDQLLAWSGHMESDKMLKIMGFGTLAIIILAGILFWFKM
jgi:hypothetical protein